MSDIMRIPDNFRDSRICIIRIDGKTGKRYDRFNIPISKKRVPLVRSQYGLFRVLNYNYKDPDVCWSGDRFTGDHYAVFQYDFNINYYIQVSRWYQSYGYAERRLKEMSGYNEMLERNSRR